MLPTEDAGLIQRADEPVELPRGSVVGRYVVIARVGAGGMGVVYAAYDPELDRKVALKVLHARRLVDADAQQRLLREAQAMAKLSHPNVVAVHDVGEHDRRIFVAMEFVEGETLRDFTEKERPPLPRILALWALAGAGLHAAHDKGLVHRDFKPDNVMIDVDGRVRVMDFGLARADTQSRTDEQSLADAGTPHAQVLDVTLTRRGAVIGTPAYMAPEQLAGEPAGPAADQFAFCVSLWEALYGQRPFIGDSILQIAANVLGGRIDEPPAGSNVPRWLRRVVQRGLAVDPAQRWGSMQDLLDALRRGRVRARVRVAAVGVGTLCLLLAGGAVWARYDEHRRTAACEDEGDRIAEVWNPAAKAKLREAILDTGVSHAAVTADKVMPWLDEHARVWRTARTEACLDATVRGSWSADTLDRSAWCLSERKQELGAFVEELSRGTRAAVDHSVTGAAELGSIEHCRQPELLALIRLPSAEHRYEVEAIRSELSRAWALEATGAYADALEVAQRALARAEPLSWVWLTAAARLRVGNLFERVGDYAAAERELENAFFEAAPGGAPAIAMEAAEALAFTVGTRLARPEEALRWSRHAGVYLQALPDVAGMREANHVQVLALVQWTKGSHEDARASLERALALSTEALGPDHLEVGNTLGNLAVIERELGAYADALARHERSLAILERVLGPAHPDVAAAMIGMANVHYAMGSHAEAKAQFERALAIWEAALGPEHHDVASVLNNLALTEEELGNYEAAKGLYARALAIEERTLGPDHPDLVATLDNLGGLLGHLGSYAEAKHLHERALAIREKALGADHEKVAVSLNNLAVAQLRLGAHDEAKTSSARAVAVWEKALGPDHPEVAKGLDNLANIHFTMGAYDEAKALYERALTVREKAFGEGHPVAAPTLVGLAEVALAQERPDDALPLVERALRLREANHALPLETAEARFLLARVLVERGDEGDRARELAQQAAHAYRGGGEVTAAELAAVERWLQGRLKRAP